MKMKVLGTLEYAAGPTLVERYQNVFINEDGEVNQLKDN